MCSWLAKSDGTSGGRVLTVIHNLNNDLSFGCHVALSNVAPGNPLTLMWPGLVPLVTWRCHIILVVVVVCVSGRTRVAAIDDETMVVVTKGGGFGGCFRFGFGGHGGVGVGVVDEVVVGGSKLIDVATNKQHL